MKEYCQLLKMENYSTEIKGLYPTSVLNMRVKVPDLDDLALYITQSFATMHTSADESTMSQVRPPKKKKDKQWLVKA